MEDYSKYYTEEKKALFNASLSILDEIDRICKKNDIRYFAFGGTLLGSVRHQGFIPWDDDIDLTMLRNDYNRFIQCCSRDIGNGFSLQTTYNEKSPFYKYQIKVIKNDTTYFTNKEIEKIKKGKDIDYKCGVFVSIFPLDSVPENHFSQVVQMKMGIFRNRLLVTNRTNRDSFSIRAVKLYCKCIGVKNIYKRLVHSYEKYSRKKLTYVQIPPFYGHLKSFQYYTDDFDDVVFFSFENRQMPCPIGYKRLLECLYGSDYMTPPPEEKRTHYHGEYIDLNRSYQESIKLIQESNK